MSGPILVFGARGECLGGRVVASLTLGEPERGPVADVFILVTAELSQRGQGRLIQSK